MELSVVCSNKVGYSLNELLIGYVYKYTDVSRWNTRMISSIGQETDIL